MGLLTLDVAAQLFPNVLITEAGMEIAEFIDASNKAESVEDLVAMYCRVLEQYGYNKFCSFTREGLRPETQHAVRDGKHYNVEFLSHYERFRYLEVDPVYHLFLRTRTPFSWEQVRKLPLTKRQLDVMDMRTSSNMLTGLSMTVHSPDTSTIGMSMGSDKTDSRNDAKALAEIFAISNQFQWRRSQLTGHKDMHLSPIHLSPREKEMLKWCSQGKSNHVISNILGISEKTVEFHLASAFKKLNVSNRTSAVLQAVNLGLIHL